MTIDQAFLDLSYERRYLRASVIFDLIDAYAQRRLLRGPHPQPLGAVQFKLVARIADDDSREPFTPPLEMVTERNRSGYYLFFNAVELPDGVVRERFLSPGRYVVQVSSPFYQVYEGDPVEIGNETDICPINLEPGYGYPFPAGYAAPAGPIASGDCRAATLPAGQGPTLLRGSVHHTDGRGMAGVAVTSVPEASSLPSYRTDATGHWVLAFDDDHATGPVKVHFDLPGGQSADVADVCVVRGRTRGLSQTGLRGWALTQAGAPIAGATITVEGFDGQSSSIEDGIWFYYFPLDRSLDGIDEVEVTATLADGSSQPATVDLQPQAISRVPTMRFD